MDNPRVIVGGVKYERYTISKKGEVYSLLKNKYMSPKMTGEYITVNISKNGKEKCCYIHILVAETYIPNPTNLPTVNHIDGVKTNNCVENLEWSTYKGQGEHASKSGLLKPYTRPIIQYDINENKIADFPSAQAAANVLLIPRSDICSACRGKIQSRKGFRFCYKEDEYKPKPWNRNRSVNKIDPKTGKIIETFETVGKAAKHADTSTNFMVKCCTKPDYIFESYLWKYADDVSPINTNTIDFSKTNYPRIKINNEDVEGYRVCSDGRIWSEKQHKYLKSSGKDYDKLTITNNGKRLTIRPHKVVAQSYLTNTNDHPIINHKDGIKKNNNVNNLEWCNNSHNVKEAHRLGLINVFKRPVSKFNLKGEKICEYKSIKDAAEDVGINHTSISAAIGHNDKSSGGFMWRYKEDNTEVKPKLKSKKKTRPVIQYNLNNKMITEHPSVKEAAKAMDIGHTCIIAACSKNSVCANFRWQYKNPEKLKTPKLEEIQINIPEFQHDNVKPVMKFDLDGIFIKEYPSVRVAAKFHNTEPLNISRACRDVFSDFGGFIWAFKEDENDYIFIKTIIRHPNSKGVVKFDVNGIKQEEFYSAKDAADSVGSTVSKIIDACNGKTKITSGSIWMYKEDVGDIIQLDICIVESTSNKKLKAVVQFDKQGNKLGEYASIKDAAECVKTNVDTISAVCRREKGKETAGGYVWRFKSEENTVKPLTTKPRYNEKTVVQFDLQANKIAEYPSISEASKITGCLNSGISGCCTGVYTNSGKFIWCYKENEDKVVALPKKASVRAKRIAKYDKDTRKKIQEYESATEAEKFHNVSRRTICDACKIDGRVCDGFLWGYV